MEDEEKNKVLAKTFYRYGMGYCLAMVLKEEVLNLMEAVHKIDHAEAERNIEERAQKMYRDLFTNLGPEKNTTER